MTPTEPVIPHFQEELGLLKTQLLSMGGLAEERVRAAMAGLVERDRGPLREVEEGDEPLNRLHVENDSLALRLLALHQPMATDLRAVVAAIKITRSRASRGSGRQHRRGCPPLPRLHAGQAAPGPAAHGRHRAGHAPRCP